MRNLLILLLGASACFTDAETVGQESGAQTSATDSTVGAMTGDGTEEGAGTSTSGAATTMQGTGSDSETGGTAVGSSTTDSADSTDTDAGDPCHSLRRLDGDTPEFDVVTDPIVAGAAIKFTASNFSATDVGIIIVNPSNPDAFVAQNTVCAMGFPPLTTYQATHCGVPTAGQYCAFLTSTTSEDLYHAVLTIDVVDGDAPECPNALSSCAEIDPWSGEACVCP